MKALADLPSSSFFLIGEEMFLMDLPLEDKWEHSNFCGLEINVHKARKMGNVIKQIVYTVCELREKKKKVILLSWVKLANCSIINSNYIPNSYWFRYIPFF